MNESWTKIDYKKYPRFKSVPLLLEQENKSKELSFLEVLEKRNSSSKPETVDITFEILSKIIYFAVGQKKNSEKRFYPSAGARYPLEIYVVVNREFLELDKGVYHFNVQDNSLEFMWVFEEIEGIIADKNSDKKASDIFIISTSIFERTARKYGELAQKFSYIETGTALQNILLLSTFFSISACIINHDESNIEKLLDIDSKQEVVTGLIAVGFN